jgi:hypothetical protein
MEKIIGARRLPRVCYAIDHVTCHCSMSCDLGDKQGGGGEDGREQHLEDILMSVFCVPSRCAPSSLIYIFAFPSLVEIL